MRPTLRWYFVLLVCAPAIVAAACGGGSGSGSQTARPAPVAKVDSSKPESELATVTLSEEARKHLAIQTIKVGIEPIQLTRTVGGELIVPPGRSVMVTAPIAGTLTAGRAASVGPVSRGDVLFELVPLQQPDRDVRSEADRILAEAEARLTQATQRLQRQEVLLKEGSVSKRSVEEAQAERTAAAAGVEAARKRVDSASRLSVGPRGEVPLVAPFDGQIMALRAAAGQIVAAGAPIAEIAQTGALWIRVPVYVGDLRDLDSKQPVLVAALGQETSGPWTPVQRVAAPPTADASAASVDLFFTLAGSSAAVRRPGERLSVRLPLKATSRALVVPRAAVVYDISGGTWVYEDRGGNRFSRRRVELGGPAGDRLIVARGLAEGLVIVTVGAAELYGTEFYVNK